MVGDDDTITGGLAEPFETILSEELRCAVIARAGEELTEAVDEALRQRGIAPEDKRPQEPESVPVGAVSASRHSWRGGFSPAMMVRSSGLEPPRTIRSTRPSTLRVYQFRHERRAGEYSRQAFGRTALP